MPKGYFISAHRSTADPEKRAAYLKLAGPAIDQWTTIQFWDTRMDSTCQKEMCGTHQIR